MKKVGAIIVTYNPEFDKLNRLLQVLDNQFDIIEVVDNGTKKIDELINTCRKFSSVRLNKLHSNLGISRALNEGIKILESMGYEWAATFDQDTLPPDNYQKTFNELNLNLDKVGVVGAYYIDRNWSDSQKIMYQKDFLDFEETFYVITSGAFVNISAWHSINGFDEDMFIDWVDWDFNKRLNLKGFKVIRTNKLVLEHEVGEVIHRNKLIRVILGINNRPIRDHSSFRQYYIFRNRIIFLKRYKNQSDFYVLLKSIIALREVVLLPKPINKIKKSIIGIRDGMKYKLDNDTFFINSIK